MAADAVIDAPICGACAQPRVAAYDLERIAATTRRDAPGPGAGLWRWLAALPLSDAGARIRLGEGGTPLVPHPRLASREGVAGVWLKDESGNATQSFKARGLALAVNGAVALGRTSIALPSAGNAGSAAAAYAAAAGMRCRIAVPEETPEPFLLEQRGFGAEVLAVPGTISDAGKALASWAPASEWWNVATFREPFRLEGKKTLGYEIAEQLGWRLPEAILYPTGGGTGLVGMWRAFDELRVLGWIDDPSPKLVSVQSEGCAPIVRAFDRGAPRAEPWENAATAASGLRVPAPFADALILRGVRETGGAAIAVSEDDMLDAMVTLTESTGSYACPEGGATLAALRIARERGIVGAHSNVVLFNTGSGLKYPEAWRAAMARRAQRSPV